MRCRGFRLREGKKATVVVGTCCATRARRRRGARATCATTPHRPPKIETKLGAVSHFSIYQ